MPGRHLSCTRLPWSALAGASNVVGSLSPPLLGPVRASGLTSYAFRRSAARRLWYARYPCSIFHHLWSRSSELDPQDPKGKWERDVTLAVPPPQFDVPGPLTRSTTPGSSYPPRLSQLPRYFFSRCHGSPRLDFQRVLGDSEEVRKDFGGQQVGARSPKRHIQVASLGSIPRAYAHRTALPELRSLSYQ